MPNPNDFPNSDSDLSDFDIDSVVADIGRDLAPQSDEPADSIIDTPAEPAAPSPAPAPVAGASPAGVGVVPGQNSVGKALPKTWKRDMAPHWEKLDPAVHDYIYAREQDVMRGIQQYSQGAKQWDTLIQPFAPVFQQYPDTNPVQIMQGLMQTHLRLIDPATSAETKAALITEIADSYGLSLSGENAPAQDAVLRNQLNETTRRLAALENERRSEKQTAYSNEIAKETKAIEAFASDPKNLYFNELGNDILQLVQTGVASSIQDAYEKACWANPAVRAKMLATQPAPPLPVPRDPKTKRFVNIDATQTPSSRTTPKGSIDDTINAIATAAFARPH